MNTLKNPPIVEALMQINYELGKAVTQDDLAVYIKDYKDFNPEEINQVQIAPKAAPTFSVYGYKLGNPTNGEFIQVTKDFFAYSGTAKYEKWEIFCKSGLSRMASFLGNANPTNINRIALRYVNRIEIEDSLVNVAKYLKMYPLTGDMISKKYENSVIQFSTSFPEVDAKANIVMRLDKTTEDKFVVQLDIDTFTMGKFKASIDDITVELEKLRKIKNSIFKDCLTEVFIETFNK